MAETFEKIVGPRTPADLLHQYRLRYLLPALLLALAAFCLLVSIFVPYWRMTLLAPQYPGGLQVQVYVNRMTGDVREIDGLNHYIGMRPLGEAAQLERTLSIIAIAVVALLVVAAIFIHSRWAALLALPALLFPALFLGDLAFWLRNFGQNLDPRAPLSSAIKPFVPPVLGEGVVGQFRTVAAVDRGFYLAVLASCLILLGLYFHRRAYKPLVEVSQQQ
jgi:copper chaperone NosL